MKQHIARSQSCSHEQRKELVATRSLAHGSIQEPPHQDSNQPHFPRRSARVKKRDRDTTDFQANHADPEALQADPGAVEVLLPEANDQDPSASEPDSEPEGTASVGSTSVGSISSNGELLSDSDEEGTEADAKGELLMPNRNMLDAFQGYCRKQTTPYVPLTKAEKTSIRLLATLKRKKTPMNAYRELLEWHLRETKQLEDHETLKDTREYVHRNTLLKRLIKRYDLEAMIPKLKQITLPCSKAKVAIPYRDAQDCIVSLLTDPRVEDKHYLFYNKNPVAPPPERTVFLEDMNTGEAMLESHKHFVKQPNQAILGIKFYIDGANTGQFSDLPMTALKMGLGINAQ